MTAFGPPGRSGADRNGEHRLHLPLERISPAHLWQLAAGDHGCCR